jgi:cysteine-rich repeat protein
MGSMRRPTLPTLVLSLMTVFVLVLSLRALGAEEHAEAMTTKPPVADPTGARAGGSCGNGTVDPGETCDDGNASDNDGCPADCAVDSCTPDPAGTVDVTVSFEAPYGVLVAGMSLLVDYPEGKLTLEGTGRVPPERFIPVAHEGRFLVAGFDLDHAVRVVAASDQEIEPGALARIVFTRCQGRGAPAADEIACAVIEASDPFQNARENVTCSVTVH